MGGNSLVGCIKISESQKVDTLAMSNDQTNYMCEFLRYIQMHSEKKLEN